MRNGLPYSSAKQQSTSQAKKETELFSLKRGIRFLLQSQLFLVIIIFLFLFNKNEWTNNTFVTFSMFFSGFELFFILLFLPACFAPNLPEMSIHRFIQVITKKRERNERIGMTIAFVIFTVVSLIFLSANIPYPSTFVQFWLTTNMMFALISVFFQRLVFFYYHAAVKKDLKRISDYFYKYCGIFMLGFCYYIQQILSRLPFLLNKLFAVLFLLLLVWQFFVVIGIYNN
jgi:hypothetical protein